MEEDIKIIEDFLLGKKMQYGSGYIGFKEFIALENLIKDYKDLHLAYELYKSKCDKLEEENEQLRIDNTNSLCEECSELAKQAGITEEDTRKILKDYRDKVENSIPISVIQNKIENREISINDIRDNLQIDQAMLNEIKRLEAEIDILQELLEERNK